MSSSLKVLIVGGGIAGPALALWLARIGCAVTVVERSPQERHTGQQIDIRGYGYVPSISISRLALTWKRTDE